MLSLGALSDYTETRAFLLPFVLSIDTGLYFFTYFYKTKNVYFWWAMIITTMTLISGP